MAAFCPHCGEPVDESDQFCKHRGSLLHRGPEAPSPSASAGGPSGQRPPLPGEGGIPTSIPTPSGLPFRPQDGEVFYRDIRPGTALSWRFAFGGLVGAVVSFAVAAALDLLFADAGVTGAELFLLPFSFVVLAAPLMAGSFPTSWLAYSKFRFWITNFRTVGRREVVGYSVDSIPLETISDVIISRSVADRLLGLSSLYIQPFGGAGFYPPQSAGAGSQFQSSNTFPGLTADQAVEVQQVIRHLRTTRRSTAGRPF